MIISLKQRKMKLFKPRIKLNYNRYTYVGVVGTFDQGSNVLLKL